MTKQEIARQRNWLKARLTGYNLYNTTPKSIVTDEESDILEEMNRLRGVLLTSWDMNSRELGMTVKPKKDRFKTD